MTFREFIKDKTIAVIGPAPSALVHNTKELLDQYDLIMRFNSAIPINEDNIKYIGDKTDILCNCLEEDPISGGKIDPKLWSDNGVSWILSPYPKECWFSKDNIKKFLIKNNNLLNFESFDNEQFNALEKELRTRPNSGFLGILHLLKFDIKKVYVTGITFGIGGYQKGYKDFIDETKYNKLANGHWHSQIPQKEYFKRVYNNHLHKLSVDDTLKGILNA